MLYGKLPANIHVSILITATTGQKNTMKVTVPAVIN